VSRGVGSVELTPLLDAVGELGHLSALYPEQPAEAWDPYRERYPELFADGAWRLPCTCYLIRSADTTVLVDTGVGPPGLWGWVPEVEGLLPTALEEHGIGRDDVDVVFLTHLHIDHLGWNTDHDAEVFFPRARYLVHRDALAFARTRPELPHIRRCVEPLRDRFDELDGEAELALGVVAFSLPGHYPGQMGVRISSGGQEAVLIADAAVHPALLDRPEWVYVSDLDPELSVETRRALLDELVDRDVLVACGHYPDGGIGRVSWSDGLTAWESS
jgi:glyoxylase-like metal-dependent hydrolase (beta-lactamase superfamily II)